MEATTEEIEAAVDRQDLFKKETNAKNIGSSEDRCEEQHLVVRRRRGVKKRSQYNVGSRQKSSATRKRVIRRAVPAVRKGQIRKSQSKESTGRGAPKEGSSRRYNGSARNAKPAYGTNLKKQLSLRMRRKSGGNSKKTTRLEMVNLVDGSITGVQGVNYGAFWKARPPPKRKKEVRTA
jgi:hypothetical protein